MENIIDRIAQFIDYKDVSKRAFEKEAEVTNGVIQRAIRTGSTFGVDNLQKIADTYPELNLNWLFRGVDKMIVENINQSENINQHVKSEGDSQANIQGINMQTNYKDKQEADTKENESSMIEFLKKQLEERDRLVKEQREVIKAKDERITQLTDKLIS